MNNSNQKNEGKEEVGHNSTPDQRAQQTIIGPVMIDIASYQLADHEKALIADPLVGGLILFSRNIQGPDQVKGLVEEIRAVKSDLIIAIDQEGGRVQRIKSEVTTLPELGKLGERFSNNPEEAAKLAKAHGELMAAEMLSLGIDISFAPVLDIDTGISQVIGDRAFGHEPKVVAQLAKAYIEGMQAVGMSATGKHFPGHGSVEADSHLAIPIDERSEAEIHRWDLLPFSELATHLDAIMPAHVIYPKVCQHPAGFSTHWLQAILRQSLKFEGVIFSDDLSMEGATVAGSYLDRAIAALKAGCDMVLVCNQPDHAREVIDGLRGLESEAWLQEAKAAAQPRFKQLLQHDELVWSDYKNSARRQLLQEQLATLV